MQGYEPITLSRGVQAIRVPSGDRIILPKGMQVIITQALGGSFTVNIGGNLARIANEDADAIGREPMEGPAVPENPSDEDIQAAVYRQLETCYDPEIPINIVDLGLVYDCDVRRATDTSWYVEIRMTLTAPGCGMGDVIADDVRYSVELIPGVEQCDVELVFEPPWGPDMMSEAARLQTGMM
ncbi:MAG: putative Fe-S cluster assembly protein SufT [Halofilum sp. (in: g-proteobacteria)]|nr:putative Fe-S cluster assembly protein SufT [Halofilum sp. (in: g-proteobacteria)]